MISREELEELKNQLSEEKAQRVARELEIHDLKDKIKDVERSAEISSADALSVGKKNKELEEAMETLRLETVMAVSGARITARWELMREWLQRKNDQWDLAKALAQYKTVVLEESKNKGATVPTFENEPTIPPDSGMGTCAASSPTRTAAATGPLRARLRTTAWCFPGDRREARAVACGSVLPSGEPGRAVCGPHARGPSVRARSEGGSYATAN